MAQSSASASNLRTGKNENGFAQHSKIQTNKPEIARREAGKKSAYARGQKQPLETHNAGRVAKTIAWDVRCPELSPKSWEVRYGPDDSYRMARYMAEIIDHDEARVMGFGAKKILLELRTPGRSEVQIFELTGEPKFRYAANKMA